MDEQTRCAITRFLAEKLFGWSQIVPTMCDGGLTGLRPGPRRHDYTDYGMVPDPFTWDGMGLVVDAMSRQKPPWRFMLEWLPSRGERLNLDTEQRTPCPLWGAAFYRGCLGRINGTSRGRADGDDGPAAVAVAAARALGWEG